jgi:urea transport system ATP-binding protein
MLKIEAVNQYYGGSHILRNVCLELEKGQVLTLLGRNGVGKTTLLLSVEENLRMGLATKPGGSPIPAELYDLFPVLRQMLHRRGGDLSGGQQQQLAIARALAAGPKLLILDEPTEGIQPSIIKDIERVIRMLAARGDMAILLVEQYYDFAKSLADRYAVMSRGEVIKTGKGTEMDADGVRELIAV